ncbi:MAG: tetratricopeptide repeat protein, partial [Nitrospirota bacterium]
IDIHTKLKSIYIETGDKEMAVTECLILAELYNRAGNIEQREQVLKEAYEINPEDPRLLERIVMEPSEEVIVGIQEAPKPALDSDVLMFNRFKEKVEKEFKKEDYETHYDLGIAYKETGLIDDAIREFQISLKDPKKFVQSSSMLGTCYMEKGLYALAVDVLSEAIKNMEERDESYWAMKYALSEAYEKNGNLKEALDLYTEVYEWNSKFRAVSDKVNQVKAMIADGVEEKPKVRKDRVSYI